ncbi:F-box only protein 15 [Camelus dromedarius]|uniref:F-box only protein 15 n=1 Tax=Camelus dromedarius TaxID=9838 RepID=A0A5N4CBE5_CAMDR|nr:F-box only protein 15 [Camelus dromedarius]
MNLLSVGDKEAGYWKREYITKQITSVKAALARVLQPVNPYLGLPVKIREALRISGLGWVIILREKSGREYVMEHVDLSINDSSVTILWFGRDWPRLATLSTLDLCGVMPVFMDQSKTPTKNGPRWHSLIAKYNLSNLAEATMMGCDTLVRLFCLHPGLAVGLWKREEELAFVMAHLHFHHLVERSALGSAAVPYELPPHTPLLDDSPECGLHGYQLHVDMHSGGVFCLCGTFRNLFTKKVFTSILHLAQAGFYGSLLTYYVDYVDPEGRVHMELVWIEETEEYFIVSLVLYLSVAKINRWFGTKY